MTTITPASGHVPVMLSNILDFLPQDMQGCVVFDCTFGAGGYSTAFLARKALVQAADRDGSVVPIAQGLKQQYPETFHFYNQSYSAVAEQLPPNSCDVVVADLGISSMQIDIAERGFSFMLDGPLDMRMGGDKLSAAEVVNTYPEDMLADIFYQLGEERLSRRIARHICLKRKTTVLETTLQLANLIQEAVGKKGYQKRHPATRCFQALRIYVNRELQELVSLLNRAPYLLKAKGLLITVAFHSLEDRICKNFMRAAASDSVPSFTLPRRRCIRPCEQEVKTNIRARSAKMRIAQRSEENAKQVDISQFLPEILSVDSNVFSHKRKKYRKK